MRRAAPLAIGAALAVVVLWMYWPALGGGFIWDDDAHVTKPELRSFDGLRRVWLEPAATQQYYPLVHSTFWLQWWLWNDDPVGYHVVNVLLHLLSALLVWRILKRLGIPGAGLAATIFAVHPVHVESVAWITELKNTLSAVFYLAAMLAYLRFSPPDGDTDRDEPRRWGLYALAFVLFGCALLGKTVTASLPAAILVIVWWKRGRISWRRDVVPLAPFFVVGASMGLMTAWFERTYIGASGEDFAFSLVERTLIAGRVFWFYLGKLLWPVDLIFIYPRWTIDATAAWQYLFPVLALVLVGVLFSMRNRIGRGPLAAVLYFGGTLFPVLGFFNVYPFKFSFVADHFQYLASLGIITLVAAGGATWLGRAGFWGRPPGWAICVALVLALVWVGHRQCRIYRDAETLWVDTTTRNPGSFMAFNNLGYEYSRQRRLVEAVEAYRTAIANKPDFDQAYFNLGRAWSKLGRTDEAISAYRLAIGIRPDSAEAHYNLGIEYTSLGRHEEAIREFEAAVASSPELAEAHYNLGSAYGTLGRYREAIEAYRAAIALRPIYAEAHLNLAVAALALGDTAQAIEVLTRALEIRPDYADARHNLGRAYAGAGRHDLAAETFNELAILHGKRGRYEQAIEAGTLALASRPDDARSWFLIGTAHARLGRSAEAAAAFEKASELDPDGETGRMARDSLNN